MITLLKCPARYCSGEIAVSTQGITHIKVIAAQLDQRASKFTLEMLTIVKGADVEPPLIRDNTKAAKHPFQVPVIGHTPELIGSVVVNVTVRQRLKFSEHLKARTERSERLDEARAPLPGSVQHPVLAQRVIETVTGIFGKPWRGWTQWIGRTTGPIQDGV